MYGIIVPYRIFGLPSYYLSAYITLHEIQVCSFAVDLLALLSASGRTSTLCVRVRSCAMAASFAYVVWRGNAQRADIFLLLPSETWRYQRTLDLSPTAGLKCHTVGVRLSVPVVNTKACQGQTSSLTCAKSMKAQLQKWFTSVHFALTLQFGAQQLCADM